jgi:hypothetical protein
MIDWMNPSEDILEAKRIGYNEGFEAGQEASREPTVPQLDALTEIERLRGERASLQDCINTAAREEGTAQCNSLDDDLRPWIMGIIYKLRRKFLDSRDISFRQEVAAKQIELRCDEMQHLIDKGKGEWMKPGYIKDDTWQRFLGELDGLNTALALLEQAAKEK